MDLLPDVNEYGHMNVEIAHRANQSGYAVDGSQPAFRIQVAATQDYWTLGSLSKYRFPRTIAEMEERCNHKEPKEGPDEVGQEEESTDSSMLGPLNDETCSCVHR